MSKNTNAESRTAVAQKALEAQRQLIATLEARRAAAAAAYHEADAKLKAGEVDDEIIDALDVQEGRARRADDARRAAEAELPTLEKALARAEGEDAIDAIRAEFPEGTIPVDNAIRAEAVEKIAGAINEARTQLEELNRKAWAADATGRRLERTHALPRGARWSPNTGLYIQGAGSINPTSTRDLGELLGREVDSAYNRAEEAELLAARDAERAAAR